MLVGTLGWLALAGCSTLEDACLGLGFDDACRTAEGPTPGPWRAVATFTDDGCAVDDGTWADGWTITNTDGGFDVAWPVETAAACVLDGSAFTCADALTDAADLSLSGTFTSASTADATLTYTGAACVSTATLALRAAWRDGLVPADGACPDDYAAYGPSPRAEWGAFTVHNRTDAPITLYQLGEGDPVLIGDISAQSALPTSGALDGYYVLANGSDVSECAFLFRLTEDGQTIVWDGGA